MCILVFDMKKLTEFLETLFTTANQRIKSPFFGSFIFSWIIINWKPIFYFLFSDDKISIKIKNIEESYEFIQNSILYPLLLSFIYVVIFPYINQFIHWLTIKAENSKRDEQHKLKINQTDKLIILAGKEKTLEDKKSGNRDISQLNEKIDFLTKDNNSLKEILQNKDKLISKNHKELNALKENYIIKSTSSQYEIDKIKVKNQELKSKEHLSASNNKILENDIIQLKSLIAETEKKLNISHTREAQLQQIIDQKGLINKK